MHRLALAGVIPLLVIVIGCGSAASPSAGGTTSALSTPTANGAPSVSIPPSPSLPPATDKVAPSPKGVALKDWTRAQLFLLAGVDKSVRASCVKAAKLPDKAYDGIECTAKGVLLLGFYAFDDRTEMRDLYFARLAENGVKREQGELCMDGKPGEGVDEPGNVGSEDRVGCYVDGTGAANARMLLPAETAGQNVYVGAVGTDGSIDHLFTALFPQHEPSFGCNWCISAAWAMPGEYSEDR